MFKTRLISGIVLVILAVLLIIAGGNILWAALGVISLIGMYELYRVLEVHNKPLGFVGYLAAVVYEISLLFPFAKDPYVIFIGFLTILMMVFVLSYPKYDAKQIFMVFFGVFYVAVMLSYVYRLRMMDHGAYLCFLIFSCSWGCDTCAYCVGKLIGKHKMSPILSPKKSVEGAIGGVLGAGLITFVFCFLCKDNMEMDTRELLLITLISCVAAFISMIGDLMASAIQRNYDIKDYGKLIPGHGGILDRFDSMIIIAPIIYYLSYYFI